ncbi:MAG TPA: DEAD/DEAH box helicase family protein [Methylomirabilota bacterium]|nr:DEAD/DEAH box helicase family protein [Methylomirabilota bacterium]
MPEIQIPIQPVENPILCSPYKEPDQHWLYDTKTGIPSKSPGRRPASYWFKTERTGAAQRDLFAEEERDDLPLVNALREDVRRWRESGWENASETTKKLLRHWWREDRPRRLFFCQIEAVETIIYLREILALGKKPRWTPKLTLEDFRTLSEGRNPRPNEWVAKVAQHPKLVDIPNEAGLKPITRYACKMATGSGKTVVMSMLIAWAFCNRGTKPGDPRFPRRALVLCPNLTIKERLSVLRPGDPGNYYEKFDLVPSTLRTELAKGKVLVTNWHWLAPEAEVQNVGGAPIVKLGPESHEAFARNRLGDLWDDEPLMVLNDEGHHAYRPAPVPEGDTLTAEEKADREEATVWVSGLDKLNAACGIAFCVDLSATPFYLHGSGYPEGSPFPWIVSDFSLVDAIESGITKIPRLPAIDNTGRPDPKYFKLWDHIIRDLKPGEKLTGGKPKPAVVYRKAEDALLTLAGEWKQKLEQITASAPGQDRTPPVMIVVCDNTDIAKEFYRAISGEETIEADVPDDEEDDDETPKRRKKKEKARKHYGAGLSGFPELWNRHGAEVTLRIDSKLLAAAESEDPNTTKTEAAEELRRIVSTVGRVGEAGERIRCVVSVNMLSEGWDANNVTHILGLRAFHSQLLCEQVVGRGLRRMDYAPDPATGLLTAEYVDIFGVPFSLIPFKGREPGGGPPPEDRPKHEVMALPERKAFEIRFPVVEGYVVSLKRHLVKCDVSKVERTKLDPWTTPTAAFVRPQVGYQIGHASAHGGFGFNLVNRQAYYDSVHPQTIEFEIAREIVRALTEAAHPGKERLRCVSRSALFPQVLRIVQSYIRERVEFNGLHPCEVGLQTYAQRIVGLLTAAITPDDTQGEAPLLPRLNRSMPIGSTERVHFKTVKPVQVTGASHLNFVACDTNSWEQAAVFQLEKLAQEGVVHCYARNDHLEFNIPYELYGQPHAYEPDFIVRLRNSVQVVLEIKGKPHEDTDAKHQAARRWVSAVNHWGRLGVWDFLVCREPQRLGEKLRKLVAAEPACA